jgi:hypothetical protein
MVSTQPQALLRVLKDMTNGGLQTTLLSLVSSVSPVSCFLSLSDYLQLFTARLSLMFILVRMESVSPIMYLNDHWEDKISRFWRAMHSLFGVRKNHTAGTHVHVSPVSRKFTLCEVKTIAFACCYYEPYVVSLLPVERRDYRYCQRNTKVAPRMGALYRRRTSAAMMKIASEIRGKISMKGVCVYVQGGLDSAHRTVLWNFQNLAHSKPTVEFRGGRHMRGPVRTLRWIAFVIVFISLALDEVRSFGALGWPLNPPDESGRTSCTRGFVPLFRIMIQLLKYKPSG